jgi:GT2 family glycosyltransferase
MLVVRRGVAAAMWPEAATWETADDLAAVLAGDPPSATIPTSRWTGPSEPDPPDESRARRVSEGVPVFGDVRFLDECVESILAQDQPPHEVVLIDDGSVSVAVDTALAAWRDAVPDVVRIDRQPNRGVCVARNRMIESMTGDAFLLVDQDDVLDSRFISSTAQALRQDRSLWAVAAWTEFFGDYEGIEAKPPFDRRVGVRENPIVSTAALVDIAVRDRGIRFSPDLAFLCCEDWHVWSQIIAAGGRMGLVPEPLIRHRVHRASGGFQRTELAHRVGRARAIEPLLGPDPG